MKKENIKTAYNTNAALQFKLEQKNKHEKNYMKKCNDCKVRKNNNK